MNQNVAIDTKMQVIGSIRTDNSLNNNLKGLQILNKFIGMYAKIHPEREKMLRTALNHLFESQEWSDPIDILNRQLIRWEFFEIHLKQKELSSNSIKTYKFYINDFLRFISNEFRRQKNKPKSTSHVPCKIFILLNIFLQHLRKEKIDLEQVTPEHVWKFLSEISKRKPTNSDYNRLVKQWNYHYPDLVPIKLPLEKTNRHKVGLPFKEWPRKIKKWWLAHEKWLTDALNSERPSSPVKDKTVQTYRFLMGKYLGILKKNKVKISPLTLRDVFLEKYIEIYLKEVQKVNGTREVIKSIRLLFLPIARHRLKDEALEDWLIRKRKEFRKNLSEISQYEKRKQLLITITREDLHNFCSRMYKLREKFIGKKQAWYGTLSFAFLLMIETGLRIETLCKVRLSHIKPNYDPDEGNKYPLIIHIPPENLKKGKEPKSVPLHKGLAEALDFYIYHDRLRLLTDSENDYLLVNKYGRKLKVHTLRDYFKYFTRTILGKELLPHFCRLLLCDHTLYKDSNKLLDVSLALFQSDPCVTSKHYSFYKIYGAFKETLEVLYEEEK